MNLLEMIVAIVILSVAHLYFSYQRKRILKRMREDRKDLVNAVERLGHVN